MLNQCTQWHFPERIGEEMRWWVCPSPTNRRVWFVQHPSYTGFVAFQSCAYLKVVPICALNLLRLGFQHTFSKSNILSQYLWERWSPFGSLTSSSPRLQFVLLFNSYHGKYRQFFWVHINHIIPSISCESVSIFFSLVSFISKRNHRSSSTMNGWTRCLGKAFQQWILPQVRFSICQMLIKLSPDRQT